MDVTLLYFDDCPNWRETDRILDDLAADRRFQVTRQKVTTYEEAERLQFRGSPTVLIDGVDPFADPDSPVGLACRIYWTPAGPRGSPTDAMLKHALDAFG